jgi:glutamyl-tRNA synthetase
VAASRRAAAAGGAVVLRIEDLDPLRCRPEYAERAVEDLAWLGVRWDEGPVYQSRPPPGVRGGLAAPARRRRGLPEPRLAARAARRRARAPRGRRGREPVFPAALRAPPGAGRDAAAPAGVVWRFRVPDGEDGALRRRARGPQAFTAGADFGDFVVWRADDVPPTSWPWSPTTRPWASPRWCAARTCCAPRRGSCSSTARSAPGRRRGATCRSVRDAEGRRLAKRHAALSVRTLRARGLSPADVLALADAGAAAAGRDVAGAPLTGTGR